MATKTEDGEQFPAGDYCYVPDENAPSTWKLRVTATPGGPVDTAIVSAAAAALGPGGFRGNPVQIPAHDRPAVVACVRKAWREAYPDRADSEMPSGIRLSMVEEEDAPAGHRTLEVGDVETTLAAEKRILGLKLLTYNHVVDSRYGPLMFEPGAFGKVDPAAVRLRMDHQDPPTGVGIAYTDDATSPRMDFRVSKTQRGNDQLTLAVDGVSRGVSVGFDDIPGKPKLRQIDGRQVRVYPPNSATLAEVSTTWMPTFAEPSAGVLYALKGEKGNGRMAEQENPVSVPELDIEKILSINTARDKALEERLDKTLGIIDAFTEAQRASFSVPAASEKPRPKLHDWVEISLRKMRGEPISPAVLKELALDDVVTTDNPGLVPDVLTPDYDDVINNDRPFLRSTRQIVPPATGTSMILPIITQRAVAGTQAGGLEKGELTTTATQVGTGTFGYESVFGGADISIQMINRAESSFFDLLTGDMGMAYALDCDAKAIAALLAGYTDSGGNSHAPDSGGTIDPEDLTVGGAWQTSITVYRRAPDTIWLNAAAVAAFIDAKTDTGGANLPLYSNIAAAFTAANGPNGLISGLRPVYVPALDSAGVDVIIGPARGFVWAEDPARNLQVDVPSRAGRDIALVGGIFPAPRYADAFTTYTLAS